MFDDGADGFEGSSRFDLRIGVGVQTLKMLFQARHVQEMFATLVAYVLVSVVLER